MNRNKRLMKGETPYFLVLVLDWFTRPNRHKINIKRKLMVGPDQSKDMTKKIWTDSSSTNRCLCMAIFK
jgi:hypothetical protein